MFYNPAVLAYTEQAIGLVWSITNSWTNYTAKYEYVIVRRTVPAIENSLRMRLKLVKIRKFYEI